MRRAKVPVKSWVQLDSSFRGVLGLPSGAPRMLLAHGRPGLGKTTTVNWLNGAHRGVYLVASSTWSQRVMLEKLAFELGVPARPRDRAPAILDAILGELRAKRRELIVVDEFDRILHKAPVVELVREIFDVSDVPVALVGMGAIEQGLGQYPQFNDRIGARIPFAPIDLEDADKVARQLCEVELSEDLMRDTHARTGGVLRLLVTRLAEIERLAKREGLTAAGLSDMEGE